VTTDHTPMHRRRRERNYDTHPHVPVGHADEVAVGTAAVAARLLATGAQVVVIESYPGVRPGDVTAIAEALDATVIDAGDALLPAARIEDLVADELTDDEVFGRLTSLELDDLFDPQHQEELRDAIARGRERGLVVVHGTGASLLTHGDVLVHADLPRWEIQQRQRRGEIGNLGVDNLGARPAELYKRGYFLDWRLADRLKQKLLPQLDFLLDTTTDTPKLITGEAFLRGLEATVRRPFRVVPFFDPGPWGGQWIKEVVGLDPDAPNYAWAFDCVPEENSLLLGFGDERVEVPSLDLVFHQPRELLGPGVQEQLGDEFPIRFDFLDTMDGGNLSLQVHPLTAYMREHFGHTFTQDESYYMLDCEPGESVVYLGLKDGVDRHAFVAALHEAQRTGEPFDDARWCNTVPAQRHDHFLIPAGTIHCSGRGGMVLEISATPYIFTFKLWDWGRLGLDGRPRPINIERGEANIVWERDATFAARELVNAVTPLGEGDGWRAERTGLHATEFIETHRHWFTGTVPHHTGRGVRVCNLVQGEEAVVESPTGAFEPFIVHYAETFIVPAAVGEYTIRPHGPAEGTECATVTAFVRGTDR
jgi:hypothetical protein